MPGGHWPARDWTSAPAQKRARRWRRETLRANIWWGDSWVTGARERAWSITFGKRESSSLKREEGRLHEFRRREGFFAYAMLSNRLPGVPARCEAGATTAKAIGPTMS